MAENSQYPDLVIVGAGLFGLTVAQQAVERTGASVRIIDVRDHIGGNAYSYMDEATGAEIHKYGAHLFHTSNKRVWEYVNRFTSFTDYVHRVYATHDGEVYPLPINLGTINQFFRASYTPAEAKKLIEEQAGELAGTDPANLNDKGIQLIGRPLYEAFIKNYTGKQWQTDPAELPADIIKRLPVRFNYDNRYFKDTWEGLPTDGYTKWMERMIDDPHIEVSLGVDFFDESQPFNKKALQAAGVPMDSVVASRPRVAAATQYLSEDGELAALCASDGEGPALPERFAAVRHSMCTLENPLWYSHRRAALAGKAHEGRLLALIVRE